MQPVLREWRAQRVATEALQPIAKLSKAALDRGLYLMTHWNVVMICPPLVITREEIEEGLAVLDEALSVADELAA